MRDNSTVLFPFRNWSSNGGITFYEHTLLTVSMAIITLHQIHDNLKVNIKMYIANYA